MAKGKRRTVRCEYYRGCYIHVMQFPRHDERYMKIKMPGSTHKTERPFPDSDAVLKAGRAYIDQHLAVDLPPQSGDRAAVRRPPIPPPVQGSLNL